METTSEVIQRVLLHTTRLPIVFPTRIKTDLGTELGVSFRLMDQTEIIPTDLPRQCPLGGIPTAVGHSPSGVGHLRMTLSSVPTKLSSAGQADEYNPRNTEKDRASHFD